MSELLEGEIEIDWTNWGGPVVIRAPRVARIPLGLIQKADPRWLVVSGNTISLDGQVRYRVTGWDAHGSALLCELAEDRRTSR